MTAPTVTRARASRKPAAEETTDSPLPAELVPRAKRIKLTKARRRALDVLLERHRQDRCGRVSNTTDAEVGLVYWQSADWLVAQRLAEPIREGGHMYLRITPAGIDQVRE